MKTSFSTGIVRMLFLALLAIAGLSTTACKKDESDVAKDYSTIDDDIIKKYLADNAITTAQRQPSGLYFLPVTTNANATKIAAGAIVSVLYTGHLLDAAGTVFATSRPNNIPIIVVVGSGRSIPGFEEGLALMHVGDKAELLLPSALAYGPAGNGPIPPNAVVRFEVEVIDYKVVDDNLITKYFADKNITTAQKQPSGLYFLPVATNPGAGLPVVGSSVSVLYTGRFLDAAGTVFDTSSRNNIPLTFVLGSNQVIKGFEEGIALMHKGDKAELFLPSALAYGPTGAGSTIPPNTVLRFEVELVDVK